MQRNLGVALVSVTDFKISRDMRTAQARIAFYPEKNAEEVHSLIKSKQKDLHNFLKNDSLQNEFKKITCHLISWFCQWKQKKQLISSQKLIDILILF